MREVLLFGAGSALIVDFVESARRAGIVVRAAVRNVDAPVFTGEGTPLIGSDELTETLRLLPFLVPLFTPGYRRRAADDAARLGLDSAGTLVDPTAIVPSDLVLGQGGYINAGCVLGASIRMGAFALINRAATIGHHCVFGDYVSIGPGATLAGQITIGAGSVVGAGAVVLPQVTIGKNAVVGAGAVVTRDVPDEALVLGNPARVVRTVTGGYKGVRVE